ncbi:MAG TPA: DEAD/DEAH box helicase [Bacteroidales bacterium]|nr:DEAD/DEAH box helicase [Bacteroidales bacterium]HSA44644.1 DEAD/DEAH box helicase [Bacteroidales bacterium]
MTFDEFGFAPALMEGIAAMGYEIPTPVQEQAIPAILGGRDVIASAQTGTGKTAAFLLPVLHRMLTEPHVAGNIHCLIIVPTRELAQQIDQHMDALSYFTHLSSIAVYGGTAGAAFGREMESLTRGTDVVICTPGRMIAHLMMDYVKAGNLRYLILDEADRMLDMGFYGDIMKIISYLPEDRQTMMFSATMPREIRDLADKILKNPVEVSIAIAKAAERVLQIAYVVYERQKIPLLVHLLGEQKGKSILAFCSTKEKAKNLTRELKRLGLQAGEIHSDLDQQEREKVLLAFKNRALKVLVATNVLSRGIDIEDIDMVVNMDVPHEGEDYIHRIGRTARAQSEGVAMTLIGEQEQQYFAKIEKLLGKAVYKAALPLRFGEAPAWEPFKKHGGQHFRKPRR